MNGEYVHDRPVVPVRPSIDYSRRRREIEKYHDVAGVVFLFNPIGDGVIFPD